jgi:DNA-binding response OmpR family regulator
MTSPNPAVLEARVLIVDDEPANLALLEQIFAAEGFQEVLSTVDPTRVPGLLRSFRPDLVLLDLRMPQVDGYSLLTLIDDQRQAGDWVPVIVLTADVTREARYRALSLGASDFLTKPFDHVEVMLRAWNLLETRALYRALAALGASPSALMAGNPWRRRGS